MAGTLGNSDLLLSYLWDSQTSSICLERERSFLAFKEKRKENGLQTQPRLLPQKGAACPGQEEPSLRTELPWGWGRGPGTGSVKLLSSESVQP